MNISSVYHEVEAGAPTDVGLLLALLVPMPPLDPRSPAFLRRRNRLLLAFALLWAGYVGAWLVIRAL